MFKQPVALRLDQMSSLEALKEKLNTLGYTNGGVKDLQRDHTHILCKFGKDKDQFGLNQNDGIRRTPERVLANSEEEFLAIAAMRDEEQFFPGEMVIRIKDKHFGMKTGDIGTVLSSRPGGTIGIKEFNQGDDVRHANYNLRKATLQEIQDHFKTNKINTTMQKEITVTGSKHLKTAFIAALEENGFKPYSSDTIKGITGIRDLVLSNADHRTFQSGRWSTGEKYTLPQDWDKALEAFKSLKVKADEKKTIRVRYDGGSYMNVDISRGTATVQGEGALDMANLRNMVDYYTKATRVNQKWDITVKRIDIGCKEGVVLQDLVILLEEYKKLQA